MTLDVKIQNGTIVDGTGAPAYRGDVGIRGGTIVALGEVTEAASRTIDAEGALVTPGWVDMHTHYDGQVSWDADLLPSSGHGVTTAVMGSCGVGFAPVRARDRERLIKLFEGVEDIPGSALSEGIDWRWESFPEYLSAIDFPHTMDVVGQMTHDALRIFVMGDRAVAGEHATPDDIAAMRALLRQGLEAGAAGFSTGRTDNHRALDGSPTPASEASIAELRGLASAFDGLAHGVLQAVSDFDMERSPELFDGEFDVLEQWIDAAHGHGVSISLMQRDLVPTQWKQILRRAEGLKQKGTDIRVQVSPRGIGVLLGLEATFHPFMGFPSYKAVAHLPLAERVAAMRDPAFRARILTEKSDPVAGDGSPVPPLADRLLAAIEMISGRIFRLGENPTYEPSAADSLLAEARKKGVSALSVIYDALLENDGHELLYFPIYNYMGMNLDAVGEMLHHPLAIPALGDGGAHVGTICDASMPTYFLLHWARDRKEGRFSIEQAVRMLSHEPASFLRLHDRGTLAVGKKADVNVVDLPALRLYRPRLVADLPAGGRRLLQDARGYRATLVSGTVVSEGDKLTGQRPGRLVRVGQPRSAG
ncbi:MAG: amidohydrolase family protein [Byssovorax sp.]